MKRLALVIAYLIPGVAPAAAHAMLEHAAPGAGATLVKSPAIVVLQYSEALEPAFSSVSVVDENGHDTTAGHSSSDGTTMSVPLKSIVPGTYRVHWHAVSVDTHRTEGTYEFRVVP